MHYAPLNKLYHAIFHFHSPWSYHFSWQNNFIKHFIVFATLLHTQKLVFVESLHHHNLPNSPNQPFLFIPKPPHANQGDRGRFTCPIKAIHTPHVVKMNSYGSPPPLTFSLLKRKSKQKEKISGLHGGSDFLFLLPEWHAVLFQMSLLTKK